MAFELFSTDPFDITGPVADDSHFYGRRTEAIDLARKLQTGQIRACFGIRKSGKTSIIHRVMNEFRNGYNCFTVVCDCSRDAIFCLDAAALISSLSHTISTTYLPGSTAEVVVTQNACSIADCSASLQAAIENVSVPLVLVFDEVDYITPASPTEKHWIKQFNPFWRNIRAIYQRSSREGRSISILVSGVSSKWFSQESVDGIENAALAFVPEEYLAPLARGASTAMIRRIAKYAGLTFTEASADIIADGCCDMPFWIRKACSFIHNKIDIISRPYSPDVEEIQGLTREFIASDGGTLAQVALQHLFRVYPELERACGSFVCGQSENLNAHVSRILQKYGILTSSALRPKFGPMIETGLALHFQMRQGHLEDDKIALSSGRGEGACFVWEEELAVIGKKRNSLEALLREIILGFFRYEMAASEKQSPKERILSALERTRRDQLLNRSLSEVVDSLYWLDLIM